MLNPSYPAPIWLIWKELWISEKLPFLFLCGAAAYSLFLATTVLRVRSSANVGRLRKRLKNLQNATVAAVCLSGLGFFAGLQSAYNTIGGDRSALVVWLVVKNFQLHFAFAYNVFLILLIVQIAQWLVANRIAAHGSQVPL